MRGLRLAPAMHRQLVSTQAIAQDRLTLSPDEAHHLKTVLRVKVGAEIGCFDGARHTRLYGVAEIVGKSIVLEAKQPLYTHAEQRAKTTLFACMSKGDRMTWTIEKATELGVDTIVPILSERTIVRLTQADAQAKQARWQRVADDASRQCGAVVATRIALPVPLMQAGEEMGRCTAQFVAALTPEAKPLFDTLTALDAPVGANYGWWTGPEGDFTPAEMDFLLNQGALPVTLGPLILRAETAAVYGLAVLGCYINRSQGSRE